jgi:FtsP/CotA-like multicopper oxidase with cupredoxin domain
MRASLIAIQLLAVTLSTSLPRETPVRSHAVEEPVARASINDNRHSAGVRHGNALTLRLVARVAMWYPDGDSAGGAAMQAFAEEGRAPSIPGPMIRVPAGTEVTVTLKNAIPGSTLVVRGLAARQLTTPAADSGVTLSVGETRTVRFRLDAPGTYYYWGTTMGRTVGERTKEDAQLTGAIIVDSADAPPPSDRVFVIGMWADTAGHALTVRKRILVAINGRSWPHTERLNYALGDTVRWRLINASADAHPMHLHGFYFHVDSRGNGISDSVYAPTAGDQDFTSLMKPGSTMSLTWSPDRAGNWLFHCHLPAHFSHRGALGTIPLAASHMHGMTNHALEGMSGLVMGVSVHAKSLTADVAPDETARRQLRLVIRPNPNGPPTAPRFEYALDDGRQVPAISSADRAAPAIVLTRAEPVTITVVNTLTEPTSVHWHGIELESYYDGVAGFSGSSQHLSPVIAPGDSFVARFTPPRNGTFIYHTHVDEERQGPAGLAGPIIVVDSAQLYDSARDLTVIASSPRTIVDSTGQIGRTAWLNGSATPTPLDLQAGVRYRLRFINMTLLNPNLRFELASDGAPGRWSPMAKDAIDLPVARRAMRVARQPVSIGETADVEFVPERAGDQQLRALIADGTVVASMSVHVRAAADAP